MSFILDALRKSEHARQRQTGPGLAEVQVAPTRPRSNVWATAAIALLVVNLVAVGVVLLRRAQSDDAPAVAKTVPAPATSAANPTLAAPVVQAPVSQMPGPPARPAAAQPAPPPTRNPLADEVGADDAGLAAERQAAAAAVPGGPAAVTRSPNTKRGSVVYAPDALDAPPYEQAAVADPALQPVAPPKAAATMPSADEVVPQAGLPALHLDLHVYSNQAQQRFVFVNSRKYREGDTLAEGPVVERITPDGAVLNFQGRQFKLSND